MNKEPVFMTMPQVAKLLRITPARAYQLAQAGQLPHVRRGKRLLIPAEAWRLWVSRQTEQAMLSVAGES